VEDKRKSSKLFHVALYTAVVHNNLLSHMRSFYRGLFGFEIILRFEIIFFTCVVLYLFS